MFKAEICVYHPYRNWDAGVVGSLKFNNYKRCFTFARNYTKQTSNLVRIYINNSWVASYRFGKEIWNVL